MQLFNVGLEARKRVLGEEYVDPGVRTADSFNHRVPAARDRVLLGRGVGTLGADRSPAQPQQPVPARRAEPAARSSRRTSAARCATGARSTSCATR